uniref:PBPe domain-containing protein n=1 Tax=Bursaphelenchus xylophilus TaxID=6326 RepID=A0A1I7ST71_BURXY
MSNLEVVVVVPEIVPPFVNYVNYTEEYERMMGYGPGIVWQVLRQLAKEMNLTYNVKRAGYSMATRWDDAFSALHHSEAEIVVGAAVLQASTDANVSFSHPFLFEATGVLYQMSEAHIYQRYAYVFSIFPVAVIAAIVICLTAAILFLFYVGCDYSTIYCSNTNRSCVTVAMTVLSAFFGQDVRLKTESFPLRVVISFLYLLSIMMFITAVGSSIFIPNIQYNDKHTFKRFEDVLNAIESSHYTIVLHENSARTSMIQASVYHDVKRLWDYINKHNRVIYSRTIDEGVQMVRDHPYFLLVGPYDTLNVISKADCRLQLLPQHVLPAYQAIAMKLDSPYIDPMNKIVLRLVEHGFINKWITGYGNYVSDRRKREPDYCSHLSSKFLPIKLPFVISAFISLAFGVVFSLAALITELYVPGSGVTHRSFIRLFTI